MGSERSKWIGGDSIDFSLANTIPALSVLDSKLALQGKYERQNF
jgi:hypothetical protein